MWWCTKIDKYEVCPWDPLDAPLTPWDPVGLPLDPWEPTGLFLDHMGPGSLSLDPVGPCRPTPWPSGTFYQCRLHLADLSSTSLVLFLIPGGVGAVREEFPLKLRPKMRKKPTRPNCRGRQYNLRFIFMIFILCGVIFRSLQYIHGALKTRTWLKNHRSKSMWCKQILTPDINNACAWRVQ